MISSFKYSRDSTVSCVAFFQSVWTFFTCQFKHIFSLYVALQQWHSLLLWLMEFQASSIRPAKRRDTGEVISTLLPPQGTQFQRAACFSYSVPSIRTHTVSCHPQRCETNQPSYHWMHSMRRAPILTPLKPPGHTNTQTHILLSAIPSLHFHTFPPIMCGRWNRPFSWASGEVFCCISRLMCRLIMDCISVLQYSSQDNEMIVCTSKIFVMHPY